SRGSLLGRRSLLRGGLLRRRRLLRSRRGLLGGGSAGSQGQLRQLLGAGHDVLQVRACGELRHRRLLGLDPRTGLRVAHPAGLASCLFGSIWLNRAWLASVDAGVNAIVVTHLLVRPLRIPLSYRGFSDSVVTRPTVVSERDGLPARSICFVGRDVGLVRQRQR